MLKLLFIGDIVGRPGRDFAVDRVRRLRVEHGIDFVVANGENAAAGAGINGAIAKSLLESGIDAITLGDHVWDQRGWETEITQIERVCRPANLPAACPGWDHLIIEARGFRVAIFTVLGRQFMNMKAECPFLCADRMIAQLKGQAATMRAREAGPRAAQAAKSPKKAVAFGARGFSLDLQDGEDDADAEFKRA